MGQKAEINGTGYDLKAGKCLVGGTAYAIKKGRTLIDGTGYDVKLSNSLVVSITGYNYIVNGIPAWKVTIDGTEYTSAEEIEVESGTEVNVKISGGYGYIGSVPSKGTGYIKFNGTVISAGYSGGFERTATTYTFSVSADCEIVCDGKSNYGEAQGFVEITM